MYARHILFRAFSNHQEACSFFAFYSLSDVLKACSPGGLLVSVLVILYLKTSNNIKFMYK